MAGKIVLADTSILIDYFRKTDKSKSRLIKLLDADYTFCISVITEYEIYSGASGHQMIYWEEFLQKTSVIPLDQSAIRTVAINNQLKTKRKQIELADLFIAAIALSNDLALSTLNKKHFERIDNLQLVG